MQMTVIVLSTLVAVLLLHTVVARPADKDDKFANIDVDQILSNKRTLTSYLKCILDEGPCTPHGTELKKVLPEALSSKCGSCTPTQRKQVRKAIKKVMTDDKDAWSRLNEKYNKDGSYTPFLEAFMAEEE